MLYGVNQRLRLEDVDSPLASIRPVRSISLVVLTGDRGLCGGYNNYVIRKVGLLCRCPVVHEATAPQCPTLPQHNIFFYLAPHGFCLVLVFFWFFFPTAHSWLLAPDEEEKQLGHHGRVSLIYVLMCPSVHSCLPRPFSRCVDQAEKRYLELEELGVKVEIVCVGLKGTAYFARRPQYKVASKELCTRQQAACVAHLYPSSIRD